MKKLFKFLTSRVFIVGLAIVAQIAAIVLGLLFLGRYGLYIYVIFILMSVTVILLIVSKQDNPIYKLAWVIPIALFPLLGWALYLLVGRESLSRRVRKRFEENSRALHLLAEQDSALLDEIGRSDPAVYRQIRYLGGQGELPIYSGTQTEYLSPGEEFFARLCQELEKAERFIFMEYFIVQEGEM